MSFTDFLENKLLDHVLGPAAYSAPANVYIGLSTTTPLDDGSNFTEPSGGGYARVAVPNNPANWPAAVAGSKQNANPVTFNEATLPWNVITYLGIFDQLTGGNLLMYGALTAPKTIATGDVAQFNANNVTVTLT
jgi:hypothetical protein